MKRNANKQSREEINETRNRYKYRIAEVNLMPMAIIVMFHSSKSYSLSTRSFEIWETSCGYFNLTFNFNTFVKKLANDSQNFKLLLGFTVARFSPVSLEIFLSDMKHVSSACLFVYFISSVFSRPKTRSTLWRRNDTHHIAHKSQPVEKEPDCSGLSSA